MNDVLIYLCWIRAFGTLVWYTVRPLYQPHAAFIAVNTVSVYRGLKVQQEHLPHQQQQQQLEEKLAMPLIKSI